MEEKAPLDPMVGRKTPAEGVKISLDGPTIVFLTVNAKDRIPWMTQDAVQKTLEQVWRKADAWIVGYYLLMPDHLHLFCAPRDLKFTIEQWTEFWKSEFSRQHVGVEWRFQRGGFHHRIRDEQEFATKWRYVSENPIRKGLVKTPEEWPFSGTVHDLRWK
ncbi:MAG: hypothetical protein JWM68_1085 [Verrucomicrobiales bacterium]|nr:hypothetical protein [Verrucomicrobiales bacterium]